MIDLGMGQDAGFSAVGINLGTNSPLLQMLMAEDIQPGSAPGYQLCKTIYSYHPLGAILADAPITLAQSQAREIQIPVLGEKRLVEQYTKTWNSISKVGATVLIHNLQAMSRVYGIASLAVAEVGEDTAKEFDVTALGDRELYFNVLDPLNTSGSLVLNQDPNSPMFLKPNNGIRVNGQEYHSSRVIVQLHEQPLYIEWTNSAFGFVGRSVYQRALYPLKTFIQTMVTDQMVTQKAGLLVYKGQTAGSFIDGLMLAFSNSKRGHIKAGVTGQVLQIGLTEEVETLNMQNLDAAAKFARDNVLKNIASAAGMPASIVNNETLTEGFGEGSEDAKKEARYLDYIREEMAPAYAFMDKIVMRKAWTKDFYQTICSEYPEYKTVSYETALHEWMRAFNAIWPNLLTEPDSEKVKTQETQFKSVVALVEVMAPLLDPEGKAQLLSWAADNVNEQEQLFASKLQIDDGALLDYLESEAEAKQAAMEQPKEPGAPRPFSIAS